MVFFGTPRPVKFFLERTEYCLKILRVSSLKFSVFLVLFALLVMSKKVSIEFILENNKTPAE